MSEGEIPSLLSLCVDKVKNELVRGDLLPIVNELPCDLLDALNSRLPPLGVGKATDRDVRLMLTRMTMSLRMKDSEGEMITMKGADATLYNPRMVDEVFKDFKGRRSGMIKALTSAEEVPPELPEPALGINFARDGMAEKD